MSEFESSCAHDSDDCPPDCPHPDHFYDGDVMSEEELAEFRRLADADGRSTFWEEAMQILADETKPEGPVAP